MDQDARFLIDDNATFDKAEAWLSDAAATLAAEVFGPAGLTIPQELRYRVGSVPGTKGTSLKVLGLYVPANMCADGVPQIYIAPRIGRESPIVVLATLAHELCHAIHPKDGHRKGFAVAARGIGLEGKLTATHAGEALAATLAGIAGRLGPYPHGAIDPSKRKKQTTRQLKYVCPDCDVIGRFSAKCGDKAGHLCDATGEYSPLYPAE